MKEPQVRSTTIGAEQESKSAEEITPLEAANRVPLETHHDDFRYLRVFPPSSQLESSWFLRRRRSVPPSQRKVNDRTLRKALDQQRRTYLDFDVLLINPR